MTKRQDMRFGIIRDKINNEETILIPDKKLCPVCNMPTVTANNRRYCTNNKCNALILV